MTLENSQYRWWLRIESACLILVMLGVFVWRWVAAESYPVLDDELISMQVLSSIIADGVPLMENGHVYWRSFSSYYLMAVPLLWMKPTLLAFRAVPIFCSVLVLPVAYWVCRNAIGRMAAWFAVVFLALSSYQNLFAAFSRFYMPFQLFFLAGIYFAGLFFIQGRSKAGWGLWVCLSLSIGAHKLAVLLGPVVFLAWFIGQRPRLWKNVSFWLGLIFLLGWCWLNWVWRPENVPTGSLALPLIIGGLQDKLAFVDWFQYFTPGGITLLILGTYPLLRERNTWWVYLYGSFVFCLVALSLVAPADNPRYMIHLYPLGVVLCCLVLTWWLTGAYRFFRKPAAIIMTRWSLLATIVILVALVYACTSENRDFAGALGTQTKFADQKPAHDFMSMLITPEVKIMSTDPGFTRYYLGRPVDYWLREQYDEEKERYHPFKDEYKQEQNRELAFYVDSPDKLEAILRNTNQEIWLYVNEKIEWGISPEMNTILEKNFYQRYRLGKNYVLFRPRRERPDANTLP